MGWLIDLAEAGESPGPLHRQVLGLGGEENKTGRADLSSDSERDQLSLAVAIAWPGMTSSTVPAGAGIQRVVKYDRLSYLGFLCEFF